ncbi:Non-specific serine/threonine protein kinase [Bertholletia excelsa]
MSKMKHLLRKLHIGGGFGDHHQHRPTAGDRPATDPLPLPSPSSAAASSSSASALARNEPVGSSDNSADFNFFEEEFQVQLALAISVSDPDGREDAETAQIKAAKQISLGCAPPETLVESLSLQYWSYNFVNYDEKVVDGFYDVYGIASNSGVQGKVPKLLDIQAISVSDNVDYEVILVNRVIDPALRQLEERVHAISKEYQFLELSQIASGVVQKIADIVVDRMGGPVSDADEMLKRWTARSYELRSSVNNIILPLGCLDIGLSRHRALLFKVLADRISFPCMLVKGSYYMGTDEGAVNLIKFDDGSEYIVDLMGAPGALIPAEVPSDQLQTSGLDFCRNADHADAVKNFCPVLKQQTVTVDVSPDLTQVVKADSSDSVEASRFGFQSKGDGEKLGTSNETEKLMTDFGKLRLSSEEQRMNVKDLSKYVTCAAKNPEFAYKHHAVMTDSGKSPPPCLFLDISPHDLRKMEMLEKIYPLNGEELDVGAQNHPNMSLSSSEQLLIPSAGEQSFNNAVYAIKQKHPTEDLAEEQLDLGCRANHSVNQLSDSTSEGFVLVNCGNQEVNESDNMDFGVVSVDSSGTVGRDLLQEQSSESSVPFIADNHKGVKGQSERECCLRLTEADNRGLQLACSVPKERIDPVLGGVADCEILWEDLQIGERVGIGSYGEVYRADWNGTEVAVKKFMNQDISGDALVQFKCEVEIMLRLRHPNVVLFMGAVTRPPNLSILTEYLPRGSLYKLLHRPNNQLDEKRRMRMALDVAKGLNYLHTSHPTIVHRDLKTPNLLVDKNWVVKVCDFGLSRIKHNTFLSSKSTAGTPEWMAPEVLRNEPCNEKSDIYSFGVILWELATLRVPWTGMNSMQVVGAVGFQNRHLDITDDIDPAAAEIITDCWNRDPQSRPSFGQLITRLKHLEHLQRPPDVQGILIPPHKENEKRLL